MSAPGLKNTSISFFDPRIAWIGRVSAESTGVRLFWSGSGFSLRLLGTGLFASIVDPINRFTLVVDDKVVLPSCGPFASGPGTLISGLPLGEHCVTLLRRSEPLFGETLISELTVQDGDLLAPNAARPQIEVIGDSITCGYGNEAAHTDIPFVVHTQNHYLTYAARLARNLNAPLSTIAWSGRGVIRNYADGPGLLMPEMYTHVLPLENEATQWHFRDATQLVLINLGTNDFGAEPLPKPNQFVEGYAQMLRSVRLRRPTTPILCTLGPMLETELLKRAQGLVKAAVHQRNAAGDHRVYFHAITTPNANPGTASHPSLATHERMANELIPVVDRILAK
jgi:lysophospholipase L1-like esterase